MKLLAQLQLSNYDTHGKFLLECDSGFQMVFGRIREMLKRNPELRIDVIGPRRSTLRTQPESILPELFLQGKINWIEIDIISNALATRYDFNFTQVGEALKLADPQHVRYDAVYINDPMLLRHYKALFLLVGKYRPRYYVHSHFIDNPECPKFPEEASLWHGQIEAAIKADFNFWQCESSMNVFFESMKKVCQLQIVADVAAKSLPWDDGYSQEEITSAYNPCNMRFFQEEWDKKTQGKTVIFVPNRIGGKGRSSDYTNCGKFMFELLPKLRERRQDFVVVCGNPSQKIFNYELEEWCGKDGYVSLVPDAFNRHEFKFVARNSHVALGLYDQDTYGGTAARECVELGCMPLWLDVNEYSSIAREANDYPYVCKVDWSDFVEVTSNLIDCVQSADFGKRANWRQRLQSVIRERCSYEATTPLAMARMGLHAG